MLDKREILDYIECTTNGKWYEPPISFDGLARSVRAAVHHSSPMYVKRNILASTFIPHRLLSQQEFSRYALDYLVFGNAYLEERQNMLGAPLQLKSSWPSTHGAVLSAALTGLCRTGKRRTASRPTVFSPD